MVPELNRQLVATVADTARLPVVVAALAAPAAVSAPTASATLKYLFMNAPEAIKE
jgi:hypothetical protein